MKCKEAKNAIRKLQQQMRMKDIRLAEMHDEIDRLRGEHLYRFNELEIIVRPHNTSTVFRPVFDDSLRVGLSVWGNEQCPTVCNYKVVALSALDLVRERKDDFIRDIGEIMAREIVDVAQDQRGQY